MKKVNVGSKRSPGRTTQYMSENFSDLADLANEKLLASSVDPEKKALVLQEMFACLELAVEKSEGIPVSPKLKIILDKVSEAADEMYEYMHAK